MLKYVILFAAVVGIVFSSYSPETCTYQFQAPDTPDYAVSTYNLANFNGWLNVTDDYKNVWFINPCPSYSGREFMGDNACAQVDGASLCLVTPSGEVSVRGYSNSSLWNDNNGDPLETMYASEAQCFADLLGTGIPTSYKTSIEYYCVDAEDAQINVKEEEEKCSLVTIQVYSPNACYQDIYTATITVISSSEDTDVLGSGLLVPIIAILVASICCCCCCCARRRRKCKAVCQQQFSNVAFQPVPATNQATRSVAPINVPSFNPYMPAIPQPQYFYYYGNEQTVHQQVPLESIVVDNSDERMARELQAKYDREAAQL